MLVQVIFVDNKCACSKINLICSQNEQLDYNNMFDVMKTFVESYFNQ